MNPSRRALIVGALAGIGALAATTIGAVTPRRVRGSVGDPLLAGSVIGSGASTSGVFNNSDTNGTWVVTQNGKGTAVRGIASKGTGGRFSTNAGGKFALVAANNSAQSGGGAVSGEAGGGGTGVKGTSANGYGVYASSAFSAALYATSTGGFAAAFYGRTYHTSYLQMLESADPEAPSTDQAKLFVRDNGAGKTQLAVRFPTGAVQVIATEP